MIQDKVTNCISNIVEQIMAYSQFSVRKQIYGIQFRIQFKALIRLIALGKRLTISLKHLSIIKIDSSHDGQMLTSVLNIGRLVYT